MSCSENENGPFIVYVLPVVVCFLTIFLVRRWTNSQLNTSSTTAVSRRRKIIKDPLVKRPLPPIACKMPAGSKKNNSAKKGAEEETTCSKKNGRNKNSTNASISDTTNTENLLLPKHMPFPFIPQDDDILFEVIDFAFVLVAMMMQYLNLYKTTWTVPDADMNEVIKMYLIDPYVVMFIVTVISRRLLLTLGLITLRLVFSPRFMPKIMTPVRMFALGMVFGSVAWCTYFIMFKYTWIKIFYLYYPLVLYFLLFGFQSGPALDLNNSIIPPLHSCSLDPHQVKSEVENMRRDFNLRLKKTFFNSIVAAYYACFVPCCFVQNYVYYDVIGASQHTFFAWAALWLRYAGRLANASHCDTLHRASLHVHRARLIANEDASSGHKDIGVLADPHLDRFYRVFLNPSKLLCLLVCLQLSLISLQIFLLFTSIQWNYFLSIIMLLFTNYYTLFKLIRDYLIAWKVYKAEGIIQEKLEKNGSLQPLITN